MSQAVLEVSDQQLQLQLANSSELILVDFWAPWCGPCRRLAPLLEDVVKSYGNQLKVLKVNVDQDQQWASRLRVAGIPALFFFRNGQVVARLNGLPSAQQLVQQINSLL